MFLGYRLKLLRKSRAMSQGDLGRALGVSKVSISGYENGLRMPSMEVLLSMLKIFNVSADFLLGRDLDVVCEGNDSTILLSKYDINIINTLKKNPVLYNKIVRSPERFFDKIMKK